MSPSTTAPPLPVQTAPGKPPLLAVQAGGRAADWTAAHRDALRQAVLNHGALLVRGLGLRSHAEIGDVFRAFSAGRLLPERESFAPRDRAPAGGVRLHEVARQPADVHAPRAELRHGLPGRDDVRLPHRARGRRGHRGGRRDGGAERAAPRSGRPVRARGLDARAQLQRRDRLVVRRGVRYRRPGRGRALLPEQRDRVRVAARRRAAHPAAARRDRPAPGHRALQLVQPDRVPQRVDPGTGRPRVPGGHLRRRRAALQHPVRQRGAGRTGDRPAAEQRVRGAHAAASRGSRATCCWWTTSAARTPASPTTGSARCSSG